MPCHELLLIDEAVKKLTWLYLLICSLMLQLSQELELDEVRGFQYHVGSPVTNSPPGISISKHIVFIR